MMIELSMLDDTLSSYDDASFTHAFRTTKWLTLECVMCECVFSDKLNVHQLNEK